jgi:predicted PurR-regulated permease PerM
MGLGKALQWAAALLLIPVTAYYLLVDWNRMGRGILNWLPPRHHDRARRISSEIQNALTIYVRGQAKVAGIEAVLFSIAFSIAGLEQPIALGVLGGILSLVPVLGFWLTALLVVLASLTGPEPWGTLLKAAIGLVLINVLEGQVLVPKIQGRGLGLHPLAVLLGVLLFGTLFGVVGVLLATPTMAVIKALLPEIRESWRRSRHFGDQIASGTTGEEPPR